LAIIIYYSLLIQPRNFFFQFKDFCTVEDLGLNAEEIFSFS
jgi:hypothetical protein